MSTLDAKIDNLEKAITAKIDGVEKKFDKMFNFAKWTVGIVAGTVVAVDVPILIKVVLPMIRNRTMIAIAFAGMATIAQAVH